MNKKKEKETCWDQVWLFSGHLRVDFGELEYQHVGIKYHFSSAIATNQHGHHPSFTVMKPHQKHDVSPPFDQVHQRVGSKGYQWFTSGTSGSSRWFVPFIIGK